MGRGATKAAGNVWYEARMEAAKWNDKLLSRAGAAEALNMSEDAVKDAELGLNKCMPVDKAVLMADLYRKPELRNYYCLHECPIGRTLAISDEAPGLERVTVKLLKNLRVEDLEGVKDRLVDIAEDGRISDDEKPALEEILAYLDRLGNGQTEGKEVDGFESCEKFVTKTALFTGVFVGVTTLCTELFCEWNENPYGRSGYQCSSVNPKPFAIVYYAENKKRLVPMESIKKVEL